MCQAKGLGPVLAALLCGSQPVAAGPAPSAQAVPPLLERVGAKSEPVPLNKSIATPDKAGVGIVPPGAAAKPTTSAPTRPPAGATKPAPVPPKATAQPRPQRARTAVPLGATAVGVPAAGLDPITAWTLGIAAGDAGGIGLRMVADLAQHVGDGTDLRVRPIVTAGETENLQDLLAGHSVDLAIVHADAVASLPAHRLVYLLELHLVPIWVLVRGDIARLSDLDGRVVASGPGGAAARQTAPLLLARLGVTADLHTRAAEPPCEALRDGRAEAAIVVAAPFPEACLRLLRGSDVQLLPLPLGDLADLYAPVAVDELAAPGLVAQGQVIETLGVPALLVADAATSDAQRARRIERLIERLPERFDRLAAASRPWRDVQPAARVPGWHRHAHAAAILDGGPSGGTGDAPASIDGSETRRSGAR
jgi:TRAP-type uncharacterized transport system substrate-binding protein